MHSLRQIFGVTMVSLGSLYSRIKMSLIIVVGLASVGGVLSLGLSIFEGVERAVLGMGDPDRAIVLSTGSQAHPNSSIPRAWINIVSDSPGIRKDTDGSPMVDAEVFSNIYLPKKSNKKDGLTALRGISPKGFSVSSEIRLISGRMLRPGQRELMVGVTAQEKFSGLELGDMVPGPGGLWPIVGTFATGNLADGDLLADSETLISALRRTAYNSIVVKLDSPDSFDVFKSALTKNPALSVTVERQTDYWKRIFEIIPNRAVYMIYTLSLFIAAGALAGTVQTMHSAVDSRTVEIAILRAIGFDGFSVAASVVLEAMILASVGTIIGTAIVWLLFDGYAYNAGAVGVFRLAITPHLVIVGITWALVIAFIGALSPSIRAAQLPVATALQVR